MLSISGVLVYICYTDIRWRRITNNMSILVLLLSIISGFFSPAGLSITIPLVMLTIGFVLSAFGIVGAGDVKLMCALSVGLSTTDIGDFLLLTGLSGIPLTLVTFLYYRFFMRQCTITIPYGVALSSGYWGQWILNIY